MKMFNLWKYSIAIFMAILLLWVNFAPKGKIEDVKPIEKTQQIKDDDLKVELKDGVVLGKYYTEKSNTEKGYYIIVWDADYNKPIEYDVDFGEWSKIHFGDIY
ncbi:hypothetical protein [Streptococcus pseudopneumoniae]|uniref:hypothetical protein n=1 Tax=Streptococcus pseudopneumoniae TaxID=257758 RepID=UPI00066AAE63|nr:hypothetical protein [Streptococcus pseudopneumoniae]